MLRLSWWLILSSCAVLPTNYGYAFAKALQNYYEAKRLEIDTYDQSNRLTRTEVQAMENWRALSLLKAFVS